MSRKAVVAAFLLLAAGCEVETTRTTSVITPDHIPDVPHTPRHQKLLDRVAADPKDAEAWFELGEFYENGMQWVPAADAYERGNALMEPGRYTGGHYLLARVYLRMQEWELTIRHLNKVVELEPKDPKWACLNPHFREAHYLRGAVYFLNKQWRPARREFYRFIEIGGDENRVEEWLDEIQAQGD